MNATADFLASPSAPARTEIGATAELLGSLEARQTVELTTSGRVRGARAVSVVRSSDNKLDVTYGVWQTNPFRPDLLSFDVSYVQPSSRYGTAKGAARAVERWLVG